MRPLQRIKQETFSRQTGDFLKYRSKHSLKTSKKLVQKVEDWKKRKKGVDKRGIMWYTNKAVEETTGNRGEPE